MYDSNTKQTWLAVDQQRIRTSIRNSHVGNREKKLLLHNHEPTVADIVDAIQNSMTLLVVEVLARAADNVERFLRKEYGDVGPRQFRKFDRHIIFMGYKISPSYLHYGHLHEYGDL